MSHKLEVFASTVPPAGRYVCPVCGGGKSREKSMQVWHDEQGWRAKCWRDKCGVRYFSDHATPARPRAPARPAYHEPELGMLSDGMQERLWKRYEILPTYMEECGWRMERETGRLHIPLLPAVHEKGGLTEGRVSRHLDPPAGVPKARTHLRPSVEQRTCYVPFETRPDPYFTEVKPIVMVEDPISCLALWEMGMPSVTLLGTRATQRCLHDLFRLGERHSLVVALDADATRSAYRIVQMLEPRVREVRCERLVEDVKDMAAKRRSEWVSRVM